MENCEKISRVHPLQVIRVELDNGYLDDATFISRLGNIIYEAIFFYEDNPFQGWKIIVKDGEIIW